MRQNTLKNGQKGHNDMNRNASILFFLKASSKGMSVGRQIERRSLYQLLPSFAQEPAPVPHPSL